MKYNPDFSSMFIRITEEFSLITFLGKTKHTDRNCFRQKRVILVHSYFVPSSRETQHKELKAEDPIAFTVRELEGRNMGAQVPQLQKGAAHNGQVFQLLSTLPKLIQIIPYFPGDYRY